MNMSQIVSSLASSGAQYSAKNQIRLWLLRIMSLLLLAAFSFSLPPILLTLGSYVYFQSSGRILPGVVVGDVDLGGTTLVEAEQRIDAHWNLNDDIVVVDLNDPNRSWEDHASTFGLSVDAAGTALLAYEQGRAEQGIMSILGMLDVLHSGSEIEVVVSLDAILAKAGLEAWAERVNYLPSEAQVALEGRKIVVHPAQDGETVDVLASLNLLILDPATILVEHHMLPLVMVSTPSNHVDSDAAVETLERWLQADITLRAYDPVTDEHFDWTPSDAQFLEWIEIKSEEGEFKVNLRSDAMRSFIEGSTVDLGDQRALDVDQAMAALENALAGGEVEPMLVRYRPEKYVVQPKDTLISISFEIGMPYWKLNEVNPDLPRRGLVVGETLVVPPKDDMLSLPVVPEKRIVISILEQRMWVYESGELIHEYVISTGIPSSPTLPGIFQISSHEENAYASIWDLYMPHFMGIYDAVPGLTNGIHGLPLLSSGRRLWADVLGNPASYGCIILDLEAAERLFYWAEEGVVVEIQG